MAETSVASPNQRPAGGRRRRRQTSANHSNRHQAETARVWQFVRRSEQLNEQSADRPLQATLQRVQDGSSCSALVETLLRQIELPCHSLAVGQSGNVALLTVALVIEWWEQLPDDPRGWIRTLRQHSVLTAWIAAELASRSTSVAPVDALLGGLLHDIGRVWIALSAPEKFGALDDPTGDDDGLALPRELALLGTTHLQVGDWFLQKTDLSEALGDVVQHHHFPHRATRHHEWIAVTAIADHLATMIPFDKSPGRQLAEPCRWMESPRVRVAQSMLPVEKRCSTLAIADLLESAQGICCVPAPPPAQAGEPPLPHFANRRTHRNQTRCEARS